MMDCGAVRVAIPGIPSIKVNMDLLIGSNAPKVLEPWEVINSHGESPYAIRMALG